MDRDHEVAVDAEARERRLRARAGGRPVDAARARRRRPRKSAKLNSGDIVAITGGPTSAGGYVWHRVTGPVREWGVVGSVQRDVWIATRKDDHEIRLGRPGTEHRNRPRGDRQARHRRRGDRRDREHRLRAASRAFSPDGDGYKDTLRLSWVNGRDLDALELRLIDRTGRWPAWCRSPAGA